MMNRDANYEAEMEDYYKHLYGEDWQMVKEYLEKITDTFDFGYMLAEKSKDRKIGSHYDPDRVPHFVKAKKLAIEMREKIGDRILIPIRPRSIAWQDLSYHTIWCEQIADIMIEKCQNHTKEAVRLLEEMEDEFGKYDSILSDRFDFILAMTAYDPMVRKHTLGVEVV